MALNNSDIEQIYKLVSGELSEDQASTLEQRISQDEELRTEFNLQQSLFSAFEEKGEKELHSFLDTNHASLVRFGFWLRFKWLIFTGSALVILLGALTWIFSLNLFPTSNENKDTVSNKNHLQVDSLQVKESLPVLSEIDSVATETDSLQVNRNTINKIAEEILPKPEGKPSVTIETQQVPLVEINNFEKRDFVVRNGRILAKGIQLNEIGDAQVITYADRWYIKLSKEIFEVNVAGFKEVNDVRLTDYFQYIKQTSEIKNVRFYHRNVKKIGEIEVSLERGVPEDLVLNDNKLNVQSPDSLRIQELIRYEESSYAITKKGAYFRFDENGSGKRIYELPSVQPYSDIKAVVYTIDLESIEQMNQH